MMNEFTQMVLDAQANVNTARMYAKQNCKHCLGTGVILHTPINDADYRTLCRCVITAIKKEMRSSG
jgi:hypothetical protein